MIKQPSFIAVNKLNEDNSRIFEYFQCSIKMKRININLKALNFILLLDFIDTIIKYLRL